MTTSTGPRQVVDVARAAAGTARRALEPSTTAGSREEWAGALSELQRLADVVAAAQDAVIARLAAIEPEWLEDGTIIEVHRAAGHESLDAPAIVSGALHVSTVHAERRVRGAVRLAADGPPGTPMASGLGGLHVAMAAGRLDAYRASIVADELDLAPPDVAESVVAALEHWFEEADAASLRRRCRRVLARVSPDLLRERARRARSESRLERWASEPGVDTWHGTFPSEEAARAWAAVDGLAQRYVADGSCEHIDRARAKALTDLVEGNATVDTQVLLTVPAAALEPEQADGPPEPSSGHEPGGCGPEALTADPSTDLVEVGGLRPGEPMLAGREWVEAVIAQSRAAGRDATARHVMGGSAGAADGRVVCRCDPGSGGLVDPLDDLATEAYRPGPRLVAFVRMRDGRCRFPGCQVAARFCDVDHVRAWPLGRTSAANLMCLCRRHHRVKQRPGWQVRLAADGSAGWVDPAGRERNTRPVDALHRVVLRARAGESTPVAQPRGRTVLPDGPHSVLEFTMEHRLGGGWSAMTCRVDHHRPDVRRRQVSDAHAAGHRSRPRERPPPDGSAPPF